MNRVLALDTEDDSNGDVGIINFFDGRRHATLTGEDCRLQAWNWLTAQAPALVWACNLEYDLINLCGPWIGKMVTLQYVSAGLLRGSWRDSRITCYDTLRHWPMSVAQMGQYLGLPKLPSDFTSVKYCRRDTEIVWRFATAMVERYTALGLRLRATLPSMALQLFKQFYPAKTFPVVDADLRTWFRRGYYGGRVEVYRFGRIAGPVEHYDVNSLFPTVMVEGRYPDLERPAHETGTPDWSLEGMAEVTADVPLTQYPCLPVRTGEELVYPWGRVRGVWPYPELRQLLADGGRIVMVHRAVEYPPLDRSPFVEYIQFCYAKRQAAKAKGDRLDDVFWKLMMNSLYGKFGQREGMAVIFQDREMTLQGKSASQANVIWAAYVTSWARLRLLKELRACREVYYTDTDSLFTPERRPSGPGLGVLKHEGTYARVEFLGNKVYVVDGVAKAKGVPPAVAPDFIRFGRCVYRKPARYRESRKSFATANVWYDVEKIRDETYTKRVVRADGRTEPWEFGAYRIMLAEMEARGER